MGWYVSPVPPPVITTVPLVGWVTESIGSPSVGVDVVGQHVDRRGSAVLDHGCGVVHRRRGVVDARDGHRHGRRDPPFSVYVNVSVPYDEDPRPDDPISVTRQEFDQLCVELEATGVPLKPDRDQAWQDFVGWRVNYDTVLLDLCALSWRRRVCGRVTG